MQPLPTVHTESIHHIGRLSDVMGYEPTAVCKNTTNPQTGSSRQVLRSQRCRCKNSPFLKTSAKPYKGHIVIATRRFLYLFSLNGHPIASISVDGDSRVPRFTFGFSEEVPKAGEAEFTGGISFLKRDFLNFGVLFVVGIGSEIALYRCVPGVKVFEDENVPPWKLVEQGRLAGSDDHTGGDCSMVKFCGFVELSNAPFTSLSMLTLTLARRYMQRSSLR